MNNYSSWCSFLNSIQTKQGGHKSDTELNNYSHDYNISDKSNNFSNDKSNEESFEESSDEKLYDKSFEKSSDEKLYDKSNDKLNEESFEESSDEQLNNDEIDDKLITLILNDSNMTNSIEIREKINKAFTQLLQIDLNYKNIKPFILKSNIYYLIKNKFRELNKNYLIEDNTYSIFFEKVKLHQIKNIANIQVPYLMKQLECVNIDSCENLINIDLNRIQEITSSFVLFNLPQLETINCNYLITLNKLVFIDSKINNLQIPNLINLEYLEFDNINIQQLQLEKLVNVKYISIQNCSNLKEIVLQSVKYLKYIKISNCSNLTTIILSQLTSTSEIIISNCMSLNYIDLTSLAISNNILINNCPLKENLQFHSLEIINYQLTLESLTDIKTINIQNLTSANNIKVLNCKNLEEIKYKDNNKIKHMFVKCFNKKLNKQFEDKNQLKNILFGI